MMSDDAAIDWAGVVHPRASAPRIACLVPSITELLFALDLAGHIVARTGFCVHPRDAVRAVPRIGGTKDPDLDRLESLAPTHLVVNVDENRRETVDAARAFVPHVIVTHPQKLADNVRLYRLMGGIFDRESEAAKLCAAFASSHEVLAQTARTLPRERVLYVIWKRPWMTVSPRTYIADTLATAGWDVVAPRESSARYPVVAEDDTAWLHADRILLSSEPYAFVARDAAAVAQVRAKPVHRIDGEMTSWYGPRAIAGMEYLARLRRSLATAEPARLP